MQGIFSLHSEPVGFMNNVHLSIYTVHLHINAYIANLHSIPHKKKLHAREDRVGRAKGKEEKVEENMDTVKDVQKGCISSLQKNDSRVLQMESIQLTRNLIIKSPNKSSENTHTQTR